MERCEKEKCCGNCCWFCFETTDGDGQCVETGKDGYPMMMSYCGSKSCEKFVSRQQMRHYQAVLLQYRRWCNSCVDVNIYRPSLEDIDNAMAFASKYMKVFGKL